MWVLPFDHGVTSAGFALDPRVHPLPPLPPDEEWRRLMHDFPTIGEQFREAIIVTDEGRFRRTAGVIQRRLERSFGDGFVLLPGTAAFLDPLHSTGNAQTLFGVARLIEIVERHWGRDSMLPALQAYDRALQAETEFLDAVVAGSFRGFARFPRMVAMSMFYFATAIYHEQQWLRGRAASGGAFLAADDPALREGVEQAWRLLNDEAVSDDALMDAVRRLITPFNLVGLCDPARRNMYAYPS
jgi:FADH2 O2-dependent halogenase